MSSSHGHRPTSSSSAVASSSAGGRHPTSSSRPSTAGGALPSIQTTPLASGPGVPPPHAKFTPVALVKAGIFAGKYMSFWLEVAQQPVSGRRKTDKDRRPVAPTPIIRLWIREHLDALTPGLLVDPSDIDVSNLVCAVNLVKPHSASSPTTGRRASTPSSGRSPPSPARSRLSSIATPGTGPKVVVHRSPSGSMSSSVSNSDLPTVGLGIGGLGSTWQGLSDSGAGGVELSQGETSRQGAELTITPIPRPRSRLSGASPGSGEDETSSEEDETSTIRGGAAPGSRPASQGSEVSRGGSRRGRHRGGSTTAGDPKRPGNIRRTAADESSRNLHGRLHIEPDRVIDMDGGMGLWFLFMNLSIRNEGTYSFHFRCFDRAATGKGQLPAPTLVDCRSKDFKVFSPRNYRGRPPNTPLADHFNRQGFKLNTRKNERQLASPAESSPPPT